MRLLWRRRFVTVPFALPCATSPDPPLPADPAACAIPHAGGGLASAGSGGGRGAIPLEEFHDTISHQPPAAHKKDSSFDFIGDHLQGLKKK